MEETKDEEVFYTEQQIASMFGYKYLSENQIKHIYHYHRGEYDLADEYLKKINDDNLKKRNKLKKLIQSEMMAENIST